MLLFRRRHFFAGQVFLTLNIIRDTFLKVLLFFAFFNLLAFLSFLSVNFQCYVLVSQKVLSVIFASYHYLGMEVGF